MRYADEIYSKVDNFFNLILKNNHYTSERLKIKYSLRIDMLSHYLFIKMIKDLVHNKYKSIDPDGFKRYFSPIFPNEKSRVESSFTPIMCNKPPNKNLILSEINKNFGKIKSFLEFIHNLNGSERDIDKLLDRDSNMHIKGMGIFITSQFLAGAYPGEYIILENKMINTMRDFGLLDMGTNLHSAKQYIDINNTCKKIYYDLFKPQVEKNLDNFGFKVDKDFNLILVHEFFWEYNGFYGYDTKRLNKLAGYGLEKTENNFIEKLKCYD